MDINPVVKLCAECSQAPRYRGTRCRQCYNARQLVILAERKISRSQDGLLCMTCDERTPEYGDQCQRCYKREWKSRGTRPLCIKEGCKNTVSARSLCSTHYVEQRNLDPNHQKCREENCDRPSRSMKWCSYHYGNWRRLGTPQPLKPQFRPPHPAGIGMRWCPSCTRELEIQFFSKTNQRKDGLNLYCKECLSLKAQMRLYGLTLEGLKEMIRRGCEVCGRIDRLHIDHDHSCCEAPPTCGKCTRGVLCQHHNWAVGYLHDSPEEAEAVAAYLRMYAGLVAQKQGVR